MNKPTTRAEAASIGAVYFFGSACIREHSGKRYTKGGACVECVELKRNKNISQRSIANEHAAIAAKEKGATTYVPNNPCRHGHSLRFVESNNCVECDRLAAEKYKDDKKFSRIENLYGLTKEQYFAMVDKQKSSCLICKKFSELPTNLHIDHCHDSGKVRGLLCGPCNQGLGLFKHSPSLLAAAINYLAK